MLGLVEVRAEGRIPLLYAGTEPARFLRLSTEQLSRDVVSAGLATEAEIDAYLALLESPDFVARWLTVMTAWGHGPNV